MTQKLEKYLPYLIVTAILLPLLMMAYVGHYSRYLADDYCVASEALEKGIIESTRYWYNNWSGRYSLFLVLGIISSSGLTLTALLPTLIILLYITSLSWTIYQIITGFRFPKPVWLALLLALLITFATFEGTPSIIQSLYWASGMSPYALPLLVLIFLIGFMVHILRRHSEKIPIAAIIAIASLTFAAGGLSEVYSVFQISSFGLLFMGVLVFAPKPNQRPALLLLTVSLIFSMLALLLVLGAPGNTIRLAQFPRLPLPIVVVRTLQITVSYIASAAIIFSPTALLISVLLPLLLFYRIEVIPTSLRLSPQKVRLLLGLSAVIAIVLVMACVAPPIYATAVAPAARVYILPQFVLVLTALFWGCVMGLGARRGQPRLKPLTQLVTGLMILVLLVIGPLVSTWQTLTEIPDFQTYATEWDVRDQAIRTAAAHGEREIQTQMLQIDMDVRAGLEGIGPKSNTGFNTCAAQYYGVDTLTARTQLQMGHKMDLTE
ncbi:MAG TPA: DUF6056 family protein [Phototrophicaceae bacterium]|nr:DUF6056 family protein [Phototrophicaceae bacterium]